MAKLKNLTEAMILDDVRTGQDKKLGHNTWLVKTQQGYGIKYHHTVVVEFLSSTLIRLNTNGWQTSTTKQRINEYIPAHIYQQNHEWFLSSHNERTLEFFDGMNLVVDIPHYYPEVENAQIPNEN